MKFQTGIATSLANKILTVDFFSLKWDLSDPMGYSRWASILAFLAVFLNLHGTVFAADDFSFLRSDGRLDITFALSFQQEQWNPLKNDRDAVESDVALIVSDLLYSCSECFFRQISREPGLVVLQGVADGSILTTVKIVFPDSRVTPSRSKRAFEMALANDDVVMYMGHSREGAAFADFGSPLDVRGKVFQRASGNSLNVFRSPERPLVLVVHSCESDRYFRKLLVEDWAQKNGLSTLIGLTVSDNYFTDFSSSSLALMRSILRNDTIVEFSKNFEKAQFRFQKANGLSRLFKFWGTGSFVNE